MNTPQTRSGVASTEFWITVAVAGFGAFTASGDDLWTRVLGVALVAIAAVAYVFGRSKVKSAAPHTVNMVTPAPPNPNQGKPKNGGKK